MAISDTAASTSGPSRAPTSPPDWALYQEAYLGMQRAGVSHDTASAKALTLALKGQRVEYPNYARIGWRAEMNVQRRAENARCDTFSTPIKRYSEGEPLTLGDTLQSGAQDDPERVALARELLRLIPDAIIWLFTDRSGPLSSRDTGRLHRFRKRAEREMLEC